MQEIGEYLELFFSFLPLVSWRGVPSSFQLGHFISRFKSRELRVERDLGYETHHFLSLQRRPSFTLVTRRS
ncbi:hypothetical protein HYC85_007841 [Camellia sinensis]|uniref:Uncharacterized protein n=1 Tax=Camellia sinensis TaxID=4442 RepID=A0A7J7HQZ6_CAMSI|nr:hypothetical protein HYC85_007841 [Camellia sinensis]